MIVRKSPAEFRPVEIPPEVLKGLQEATGRMGTKTYPLTTFFGRYLDLWNYASENPGLWGRGEKSRILEVGPGAAFEVAFDNIPNFKHYYPTSTELLESIAPGILSFLRSPEPLEIFTAVKAAGKQVDLTCVDLNPDVLYIAKNQPYLLAGDGPPFVKLSMPPNERLVLKKHYERFVRYAGISLELMGLENSVKAESAAKCPITHEEVIEELRPADRWSLVFPSEEFRNSTHFAQLDITQPNPPFRDFDVLITLGDIAPEKKDKVVAFARAVLKKGGYWFAHYPSAEGFHTEVPFEAHQPSILRKK